jgi:hypothetical protein
VAKARERSLALFGKQALVIAQLDAIAEECSQDNWDGYDAIRIDDLTQENAGQVLRSLPDSVPMPEVAPDPDGSIAFDWVESRNRRFSLSIGANGRLAYAWIDGTDKGYAVARFDGVNFPDRVLYDLHQIVRS